MFSEGQIGFLYGVIIGMTPMIIIGIRERRKSRLPKIAKYFTIKNGKLEVKDGSES